VTRARLLDFVGRLEAEFARPGCVYLVGETTQVWEGWRERCEEIELTAEVADEDRAAFARLAGEIAGRLALPVIDESPADVIPLPDGFRARARRTPATQAWEGAGARRLSLRHFDPCSVALRFIARGDEPDYHMVLMFMEHGWVTEEEMNAALSLLLGRFTAETIQQDPAEFRRKYKGLLQMWRAVRPCTTHRPTTV
jgi:hypothetical protein